MLMYVLKLQKILELYALVRRVLENQESLFTIKEVNSIVLSLNSWLKVETLQLETELEVNQSTV